MPPNDPKPRLKRLWHPSIRWLAARDVTATQVALAALVGSLAISYTVAALSRHHIFFVLLPLWLIGRSLLYAVEELLARETAPSRTEAMLMDITKVASDAVLILPFAYLAPFKPGMVAIVVALAVLSDVSALVGRRVGAKAPEQGPMGSELRALTVGGLGLWIGLHVRSAEWLASVMVVIGTLIGVTLVNRVKANFEAMTAPPRM